MGLPISTLIYKHFLQNLEGKFIKSSSKSKALIHYPMGCPRRHCTPDLFIYLFHPARIVWIRQIPVGTPHAPHTALCIITSFDLIHGIHGVQEMQVTVMTTHNAHLVHRLLSSVLKVGLNGHHGNGEDVAQPQPIH